MSWYRTAVAVAAAGGLRYASRVMKAKRKKKARVAVEKGLFERRKAEKQKAREEDQRALDSGEKSREDLHRENSLFYGVRVRILWDKAKHLC